MRKLLGLLLFTLPVWADDTVQIKPVATLPSAKYLSVEAPFRCSMQDFETKAIATSLSIKPNHFKLVATEHNDPLPRYRVNGLSLQKTSADQVVQLLVKEAGIKVYTTEKAYPTLSTQDVYGELDKVLDSLSNAGEFFYRYNKNTQNLTLTKYGYFDIQLPQDSVVMLAVLDAFRGSGIVDITPNWNTSTITVMLTKKQYHQAKFILDTILKEGRLLLMDVHVYAIDAPEKGIDWQTVISKIGMGKIYATASGLVGKMVNTGHIKTHESWADRIAQTYPIELLSKGIAVVPNGWKARFDVGRCAVDVKKLNALSLLLTSKIKTARDMETQITLDTSAGEISSFTALGGIDEELVIVGIPATIVGFSRGELLITFKLRLIRLTKEEGENK